MAAFMVTVYILFMLNIMSRFHEAHALLNLKTDMTLSSVATDPNYPVSGTTDGIYGPFAYGVCMASNVDTKIAWWRGDFTTMAKIRQIDIVFRLADRAAGYALWVSNDTRIPSGYRCYDDVLAGHGYPALIQNITCHVTGQSVMIYITRPNNTAHMDVCEVDVDGCFVYTYGSQCQNTCYCKHGCNPDNGDCDTPDCQTGWYGPRCNQVCGYQTFGENCLQTCHCKNSGCDRHTGQCATQGCVAGYMGLECNEQCNGTTFGDDCLTTCHCNTPGCHHVTGTCNVTGCAAGWKTESCNTSCATGEFGKDCLQRCHCAVSGCDVAVGTCTSPGPGCQDGWNGTSCSKECGSPFFGNKCGSQCNCKILGCNHVNGTCGTPGCLAGWKGESCTSPCATGEFGTDCLQRCHCTVPGCDVAVGTCTSPDPGCQDGWNGTSCSTDISDCTPGKYGNMCDMDCSTNCRDGCDKTNGFCTDCISGKHGDVCDKDCSTNCRDNICDKDTANCFQCEAGFYGNKCDTQCDTSCKTNSCYQNSGECIAGAALSVTCGPGARPDVCDYPTTTSCTEGTTPGTMICRCNQGYFDSNGYSITDGMCTPMSNLEVTEVKSSGAVGSTSVTITWTPPSDFSQISSYSVVWRVSGSADVAGSNYAGKSESATITGLTPDTSYVFTVESTETGSRATPQKVESDSHVIITFDAFTCTNTTPWIAAIASTSLLTVLLVISTAFFWNRSRKYTGKHKEESHYETPERVYVNTDMKLYELTTEDSQQAARTGTDDEYYSNIDVHNTAS